MNWRDDEGVKDALIAVHRGVGGWTVGLDSPDNLAKAGQSLDAALSKYRDAVARSVLEARGCECKTQRGTCADKYRYWTCATCTMLAELEPASE